MAGAGRRAGPRRLHGRTGLCAAGGDRSRRSTRRSRAGSSAARATISPRATGGSSSTIRCSTASRRQVEVSNQTLKADEANFREAEALIAEARAAAVSDLRLQSLDHALDRPDDHCQFAGQRELDARSVGPESAARSRARSPARRRAPPISPMRNSPLQSTLATAYFELRETDSLYDLLIDTVGQYKRSLDITQNQYKAGTSARSDVITAQALVLTAQAQAINTGVARAQYEHAIAVADGPPARRPFDRPRQARRDHRRHSGQPALGAARAPARHRRRRARDAGAERADRRRRCRLLPRHHPLRVLRLCRESVRRCARGDQSGVVGRRFGGADPVQRRPDRGAGRGGARHLPGERRDLSADRAHRVPAGRGPAGRDSDPVAGRARTGRGGHRGASRRCRSRSTNIRRGRRISRPS